MQKLQIVWQDIAISITYNPNTFNGYKKVYGHGMAHLQIQSLDKSPLPISTTGERSRYIPETIINDFGSAAQYAKAWLDDASQSKAWKAYIDEKNKPKQLKLF